MFPGLKNTAIAVGVIALGVIVFFIAKSILQARHPVKLQMRVFQVDKAAFYTALENVNHSHPNETDDQRTVSLAVRNFFKTVGIDLSASGRSVAFNEKQSLIFVKATASELDSIEHAVQTLSRVAPQIHVKARFIEVPQDALKSIWKAGTVVSETETNTVEIISSDKFKPLMRQLENSGAETLAEPEVITIGGRQTQMRATDLQYVLTHFASTEARTNSAIVPQTEPLLGPTIDLVPNVLTDGYTINLKLIPELLQFDQDAPGITASNVVMPPTVLPHLTVREVVMTVNIWDNQTVVLGNLKSKFFVDAEKNSPAVNKELMIFVTATIIDPAGNRVHSDDELPFNPSAIPPQN